MLCVAHTSLVAANKAWIKEKRELLNEVRSSPNNIGQQSEGSRYKGEVHGTSSRKSAAFEINLNSNFGVKAM
jgi:hypothetical protein